MVGRGAFLLRALPPVRRSLDQVVAHAAAWERRNAAAASGDGPLWAVLGDSVAQGVGVADVEDGLVCRVRRLLEARDGRPWRVVNLSRSGALLADLVDVQLPALRAGGWSPALVSAVAGGNDLRSSSLEALLAVVPRLVAAVPDVTVLATLPQGIRPARARAANAELLRLSRARDLPVVDLWGATGPPWRGKYADGLHPGPVGLTDWVAAFATTLGLPAETGPPRVGHTLAVGRRRSAPVPRPCPCGLGAYATCCGPLLDGTEQAPTAQRLMRSRFTAHVARSEAYLLSTWHSATRPPAAPLDPRRTWLRLEVLGTTGGGLLHAEGEVEFRAHSRAAGLPDVLHARSRFAREAGLWRYLDDV